MTTDAPTLTRIGPALTVRHAMILTKRNVLRIVRIPQLLVFSTIQPVMFVLLFAFVFGGAITIPGVNYIDFLIPGIFIQTSIFGSTNTSIGLTEDLQAGIIDRFRSLPIARSAVLAGRTLGDVVRNVFVVTLMTIVGYAIGFRFQAGFLAAISMLLLTLLVGFTFSWISASIGLAAKTPEAAQAASFIPIFPFVFASSAFVPVQSMPDWLAAFARNQPVTRFVDALRALTLGGETASHVTAALIWVVVILAVFVPLSVRLYRRSAG